VQSQSGGAGAQVDLAQLASRRGDVVAEFGEARASARGDPCSGRSMIFTSGLRVFRCRICEHAMFAVVHSSQGRLWRQRNG
jgi:hypothetical protein